MNSRRIIGTGRQPDGKAVELVEDGPFDEHYADGIGSIQVSAVTAKIGFVRTMPAAESSATVTNRMVFSVVMPTRVLAEFCKQTLQELRNRKDAVGAAYDTDKDAFQKALEE